jgi:hypothetical protein
VTFSLLERPRGVDSFTLIHLCQQPDYFGRKPAPAQQKDFSTKLTLSEGNVYGSNTSDELPM